ncbi:MAG: hypothetical protein HOV81_19980 [Kofleriaceae bacterium]|nr:hypothetical protein [Kofleriaceae bacterium]
MKHVWVIGLAVVGVSAAHADPATDRCAAGLEFAKKGDLPRAALYLDGCTELALPADLADEVGKASADVMKKLRASELSALSISTTPSGLIGQTDALPGETFTTPATIWTRAGTYNVVVAADAAALAAGKGVSSVAKVEPHSRGGVIINAATKEPTTKDGVVDFTEDTPEQSAHEGPPPAVKLPRVMPKKYLGPVGPAGPQLDDPFATRASDAQIRWRLGARFSAGMIDQGKAGVGFGVAGLAARPLDGPAFLAARLDWSHRDVDTIGINAGVAVKLVETTGAVLLAGAALRGEVRIQDTLAMQPVSRAGIGGAVDLDLAILSIPVAVGLRFEQGFSELVPGTRDRALLVEVGYDWR